MHPPAPAGRSEQISRSMPQPGGAAKLVWHAADARDNIAALELQYQARAAGHAASVFCMGDDGLCSRVLGRKFGAALTFAALARARQTAPGQPTLDELLGLYRWRNIDQHTSVYGVIGDPVAHSFSPAVHNAAFAALGLNAVYVPLRVPAAAFREFIEAVRARPWLDFRGFSVTAPHKECAFQLVPAANLEAEAQRLGAVNTLLIEPAAAADAAGGAQPRTDGRPPPDLRGANTDAPAALAWLQEGLGCSAHDLRDRRCAVLGSGGLARTVAAVLSGCGARVSIHGRTPARTQALAREFSCDAAPLGAPIAADVIIHCTPAGTWPEREGLPVDPANLPAGAVVFDAVYNPQRTMLLQAAAQRGCRTIGGLDLFTEQAALQFERWTSQQAPRGVMRAAALQALRSAS
jgi:3-dehydroquinate dehydratase/shikimate dehydrogenase